MKPIFSILIPLLVMYGYYCYIHYDNLKNNLLGKWSFWGIFILSILGFLVIFYDSVLPSEWDFTCFFLIGKVAHMGLDIYNPDNYYIAVQHADIPFTLSEGFRNEFMVTACLYPPPTALLFLPLGLMKYMQGLYFWYGLIFIFMVGCLYLVRNTFFDIKSWRSWALVCIVILAIRPLRINITFAQTLIFLLFLLILVFKYREKRIAGLFLSISIFIKPFALILIVYFLLRKRWDILVSFLISTLLIGLLTLSIIGINPFLEYLFNSPTHRIPPEVLYENVNQSLFAVLYRALGNIHLAKLLYYSSSILLLGISGFAIYHVSKNRTSINLLFPLLLSLALLIYPNTLEHYGTVEILSLFVILNFIKDNRRLIYAFLFLFYMAILGNTFLMNIYIFTMSLLLIFDCFDYYIFNRTSIKNKMIRHYYASSRNL